MELFKILGTIAIDNHEAITQIDKTAKEATNIGKSFNQAKETTGKSLNQIAAENGKTVNQIRSEVATVAAEYKRQGMTASDAMKKAYADIGYNASKAHEEINEEVENTGSRYNKLCTGIGKVGKVAGKFAVAAGKVIAQGLIASSVAMGKLIQSSIESYAEYEQLVGGMETLFKDSSSKVMEYAQNAYKTAGLSANEYMSTVTGFSASLLQSMGGDTEAAADIADMAIRDMADNANKMGTDMGAIQNAYQGFAKQNYTINLMSAA